MHDNADDDEDEKQACMDKLMRAGGVVLFSPVIAAAYCIGNDVREIEYEIMGLGETRVEENTMANTFDWIEIRTNDIQKTADFYESLFGWKVTDKETAGGYDVWLFDTGGEPRSENLRRGGIWLRPEGDQPGVVVYILVEDIERALQKVTELGGKVVAPRMAVGAGYAAFFVDPCGNQLGLYEEGKSEG